MSDPKKPAEPKAEANRVGHVRHDPSGRAIWEWAANTGRHALDSTSRLLLKRLEVPGLSVVDDAKKKEADKPTFDGPPAVDPAAGKRQSFNPYADTHRPPPRRPAAPAPPAKPAARTRRQRAPACSRDCSAASAEPTALAGQPAGTAISGP